MAAKISDAKYRELLDIALASAQKAYAPYSCYKVGAAVLAADGRIFSGCNVENKYISSGICAERCAIVKAVSEGATELLACAVACATDYRCYPCGLCRQVLSEWGEDLELVVRTEDGYAIKTIGELLPRPVL